MAIRAKLEPSSRTARAKSVLEVDELRPASFIAAVGFDDIFIVHDGDNPSLAFVSDVEAMPAKVWRQMMVDNCEAGVYASTVAELKVFWRESIGLQRMDPERYAVSRASG